jgi:hypothetical protein
MTEEIFSATRQKFLLRLVRGCDNRMKEGSGITAICNTRSDVLDALVGVNLMHIGEYFM